MDTVAFSQGKSEPPPPAGAPAKEEAKPDHLTKGHLLGQLASKVGDLIQSTGHDEMYGVQLAPWKEGIELPVPQQIILQKFLRANAGEVTKAADQLEKALKWRKEFQPLKAKDEVFDKSRFDGLGYVTELKGLPGSNNEKDVAVFNIYGAVKDNKKTFGDLDCFIRWRVALMEITIDQLNLNDAKAPLPDYGKGPDPYQAVQIHDYLSVSFLRQAPEVKAASSKTIQLFQANYPETMSKKFFVNVPIVMQWMFAAMQVFMAKETIAKMKWMSYGNQLVNDLGPSVPKVYGGTGPELTQSGITPRYDGEAKAAPVEATKATEPPKAEETAKTEGEPAKTEAPAATEQATSTSPEVTKAT